MWSHELWCRDREIHRIFTIALLQIGTKSNATTFESKLFVILYWMKLIWGSNSFSSLRSRNLDGRVNFLAKCRYRTPSKIQRSTPSSSYEWIAAQTESSEAYLSFQLASDREIQTFTLWLRIMKSKISIVVVFIIKSLKIAFYPRYISITVCFIEIWSLSKNDDYHEKHISK